MFRANRLILAFCVTATVALTGCGTTAKFTYPVDAADLIETQPTATTQKAKVAVPPFDDLRGNENQYGTLFLYLLPLSPFGYVHYERPDAARGFATVREFEFESREDLAKAAAYSLRESQLFDDAFFTFGGRKSSSDLVLEGEIMSTTYDGKVISYGLSFFGTYLWFIGFPAATSSNNLELSLTLRDQDTEDVVWNNSYDFDWSVVQGFYYNWGHDTRGYAYMMQDLMNKAIRDMRQSIDPAALSAADTSGN